MSVQILKSGIVQASGDTVNPNLLKNTLFTQQYTQSGGWDTSKNGTILASNWGGYNSGVPNASTVYHAHPKWFGGEWVYEYIRTSAESWLGISQGFSGTAGIITANTTYTASFDQWLTPGCYNYITVGIYHKQTSDGSANFHAGCTNGTGDSIVGRWCRRYFTFTITSFYTGYNPALYIYGHMGTGNCQGTVYMRRPKLEKGSVATPWCPHVDEGYNITNHGFVETSEYKDAVKLHKNYVEMKEIIEI